jgi:hypothetical protein
MNLVGAIITGIDGITGYKPDPAKRYDSYEGYHLRTSKGDVWLLIDDEQNCCERFGFFSTPDDPQSFVGARITGIAVVTEGDSGYDYADHVSDVCDYNRAVFVNVDTDIGQLQLAVYNAHNGYYGHDVKVVGGGVNYEGGL